MEEYDGNYDSDEDVDFTKMDMVNIPSLHALCIQCHPVHPYRATRKDQSNGGILRMKTTTTSTSLSEKLFPSMLMLSYMTGCVK